MLTFLIFLMFFWVAVIVNNFNYYFLIGKALKNNSIKIGSLMVERIEYANATLKRSRVDVIIYSINNYVFIEKDMFTFSLLFFVIPLFPITIFFLDESGGSLKFFLSLITIFAFYIMIMIIVIDLIHHILYKKKRIMTDCIIVLFRNALQLNKKNKEIDNTNIFIGKLFFADNKLVVLTQGKRKKDIIYNWYDFADVPAIKCNYKENTVVTTIETKDDVYTREFSKFIFESDQVEKDYFNALYEFPFMERSTVYDFERLHHDIMQDLVDEERTFYFKDYLIKEEAS